MKTNFVRLRLGCRVATVVVVLIGAAYPFSSVHAAADTGSITITPTGFILNKGQAALTPATKRIVKIDVGAPTKPGTDTLIIEPPGGAAGTVQVKLNGNETPAEKADKLATALTAKGIPFARAGTEFAFGVDKITAVDRTEQPMEFKFEVKPRVGAADRAGRMDFAGALGGVDADGAPAVYEAALGFDTDDGLQSIRATDSIAFNSLLDPTIDGLLERLAADLRGQLPSSLQSSLLADLPNDRIVFEFPSNAVNMFVQDFTSDVALDASVQFVPEPGSLHLLGAALLGALAWRRYASRWK